LQLLAKNFAKHYRETANLAAKYRNLTASRSLTSHLASNIAEAFLNVVLKHGHESCPCCKQNLCDMTSILIMKFAKSYSREEQFIIAYLQQLLPQRTSILAYRATILAASQISQAILAA
jgi:hypothetical protein